MKKTIAFDVYGTLIDTQGVLTLLETYIGDTAQLFSDTWRSKQLEYSFRKGLMDRYEPFSICTEQALNFCCDYLKINLSIEQKRMLMESYKRLPAFADVTSALIGLKQYCSLIAFSNGEKESVEQLLNNANIAQYFTDVVSADEVRTFKPSPVIYQYLLTRTASKPEDTWLISSNPFDVIGARSEAINAVWVKRSNSMVYDPWGIEPNVTIKQLGELILKL